ncbi:M3 family oligoendopeptidase [Fulvimarina endophytica]|uniref:M3 family oligoendopeptidase n=1 Tax=Fulvimarina endophytica TaxID=2293836 RepID=A0A371WYK9_9HYPH|nr:M3 family oligoendopeptidase [Fulvimarina endophytica]RFC62071.1 M3 family oligoendopeptidase [Fulvimarina endophytica]
MTNRFLPIARSAAEPLAGGSAALPEWNLDDLYPAMDSPELKADLERARADAALFKETWRGRLADLAESDPDGLARSVADYEKLEELLGRIISYAGLVYAGDTADPMRAKFYGDIQGSITDVATHLLFYTLEMNRIEDAVMDRAMESEPKLAHYRPWLVDLRKDKPFQLEDRVEELFHEKGITGAGAWNRLFDETLTSLRFTVDGDDLGLESTLNLLQDEDREKRRKAAAALTNVFSANLRTFTLITNTLAKDKEISDRWRGFTDVADSRHLANRVEREVVDALNTAVTQAYPSISHRYYAMKAKWLGLDVLDYWDRNAPLPDAKRRDISWSDARETVLSAYSGFSPQMAEIANRFFERDWIDASLRPGKSPGAFAHPTVPSVHPYVLLNYMGKPRDVMTLAHELGHGVHQVLAGDQGALMAATPLTLAETASVFGEMLTFRSLLAQAKTQQERKTLLASKVEDMINTVVRQIAFYQFERALHEERKGGELTAERIGEIWLAVQGRSLGPAVRLGDGYETFWTYVPHFIHSPFYVYAYAFGDCLVNSLYSVYENAETGFQEKYFAMLKAGGTKHHSELLAPFGLDASDPAFWSKGLQMISGFIDELEAME